jgi:hypothetical protein
VPRRDALILRDGPGPPWIDVEYGGETASVQNATRHDRMREDVRAGLLVWRLLRASTQQ